MAETTTAAGPKLTIKDFQSDQDVRWCPGCGDYSILAQVQRVFPEFPHKKENYVAVSGIGCSSRFPYYMDIYGLHGIHGRATAIASGVKMANPKLDVWVATGDGDGLSIGGNHMIHMLRRNIEYQSPSVQQRDLRTDQRAVSPPPHSSARSRSPPRRASLTRRSSRFRSPSGAGATFVARTMDRDPKHLQEMVRRAEYHHGSAFVEIYQNCNVFNDGAFFHVHREGHPRRQRGLPRTRKTAGLRQEPGQRHPPQRFYAGSGRYHATASTP